MPLYEQIIVTMPKAPAAGLVELFKRYTKTLISNGGNVRGIENHGIRPLPEQAKRYVSSISRNIKIATPFDAIDDNFYRFFKENVYRFILLLLN